MFIYFFLNYIFCGCQLSEYFYINRIEVVYAIDVYKDDNFLKTIYLIFVT